MGQRIYTAEFENVTISAIQDIFSLKAGAANGIEIHTIELSAAASSSTPSEIRLRLKRLPATVTQGSAGSVPTIQFVDDGDTKASTAVVHANDTTIATTTGTAQILSAWQWNVILPFQYLPPPEDREVCQAAELFSLDTPAAPTSIAVSGYVKWREVP